MSLSVSAIEERIKAYEEEIARLVTNHSSLTGALNELKQLLTLVVPVVEALDPELIPVVEAVEAVVDAISSKVNSKSK